jgi:hypothetical protein
MLLRYQFDSLESLQRAHNPSDYPKHTRIFTCTHKLRGWSLWEDASVAWPVGLEIIGAKLAVVLHRRTADQGFS